MEKQQVGLVKEKEKNMEYKRCEKCKGIIKIEDGEIICECPYCGSDMGFTRASEKEWREYYRGIKMQPFEYRKIKPSTQTTFVKEIVG